MREQDISLRALTVSKTRGSFWTSQFEAEFDAGGGRNGYRDSKPHFEGYLLAAERIGVDPRLCVMVEDAQAGLEGARALSMRTIGIGAKLPAESADYRLVDTTTLQETLGDLIRTHNG